MDPRPIWWAMPWPVRPSTMMPAIIPIMAARPLIRSAFFSCSPWIWLVANAWNQDEVACEELILMINQDRFEKGSLGQSEAQYQGQSKSPSWRDGHSRFQRIRQNRGGKRSQTLDVTKHYATVTVCEQFCGSADEGFPYSWPVASSRKGFDIPGSSRIILTNGDQLDLEHLPRFYR